MSNIDATLAERGSRYGEFEDHALVTQSIKRAMYDSKNWAELDDDKAECLEMVAHKIGRILNGDSDYIDSYTDIIGYVRLVEKRLLAEHAAKEADKNAASIPKKDMTARFANALADMYKASKESSTHSTEIIQAIETLREAGVLVYP